MRYTWKELEKTIVNNWPAYKADIKVWGVPRGGTFIAMMLQNLRLAKMVDTEEQADLIVDDLVDSGRTMAKYNKENKDFWAPIVKENTEWIEFPWEQKADEDHETIIVRYIEAIGDDPKREGVLETPKRVVKSWKELYSGYTDDAGKHLSKCFDSTSKEMVICKDIEFYSMCEHHMIPFVGKAHIGYIPDGKVVGLSKLARTIEVFARRLQIQEQLCEQVADAMVKYIPNIKGCAVVMESKHFCMCSRGVGKQNSQMITSSLRGHFTDSDVRKEFLSLIKG